MRLGLDHTVKELRKKDTTRADKSRHVSGPELLEGLRGVAFESYERAIDAHIKNIRRKLEPDLRNPRYVLTIYGVGYKFADV